MHVALLQRNTEVIRLLHLVEPGAQKSVLGVQDRANVHKSLIFRHLCDKMKDFGDIEHPDHPESPCGFV